MCIWRPYFWLLSLILFAHFGCKLRKGGDSATENAPFKASFSMRTDSIWEFPSKNDSDSISIIWELRNEDQRKFQFVLLDAFRIWMEDSAGNTLQMVGGRDGLATGGGFFAWVNPQEQKDHVWKGKLGYSGKGILILSISDPFQGKWEIGPLESGNWHLHGEYRPERMQTTDSATWMGYFRFDPLPVRIVSP